MDKQAQKILTHRLGGTGSEGQEDLLCHKTSPLTLRSVLFLGHQSASQGRAAGPSHPLERRSWAHRMPRPKPRSLSQAREKAGFHVSVVADDAEGKPGLEDKGISNLKWTVVIIRVH